LALRILAVLVVPIVLASCGAGASGSSKPPASVGRSPCAYIGKLDEIANSVAQADVRDPDGFSKTLKTAVRDYVANVRGLRAVAPADLAHSLDRVQADVQQYRFDAALTDRAAVDAYASRTCGRVVQALTTTTLPGSTVAGDSTTTSVSDSTTSTSISGG
jgi:hypothetical protein